MPLKKKLKAKDFNKKEEEESSSSSIDDSDNSDSGSDNSDEDIEQDEEVMIDFEARSLAESDLDLVKQIINQKFPQFPINVHELSKIIVQQDKIGNVIYQAPPLDSDDEDKEDTANNNECDEDTIFGVLSIIDLKSERVKSFTTGFISFLQQEAEKFDSQNKNKTNAGTTLKNLLKDKHVFYVVNERFINIPVGISVPMFESLLKDLDAANDSPVVSNETNSSDYWLFISKVYNGEGSSKMYANAEEEVFEELSEFKFQISYENKVSKSTAGKWSKDDEELQPYLNALFVPRKNINDALSKIKTLL